ncbi:MAG: protein-L-isoaspartate(D-aspartate) O-methyltransferase [Candidatus Neomarinimicrobiota bacterium]|jgi:protein-L-isoaspartate(D-aspartate) O-methyltransferase|nr:protein-L-isoaspartate(D-aspartate) O-methyltransferase [Candidatus Neomarinimicrobiota bacterium]MDX9780311.1 protein-L-isoaspartate(D-aspartate) O-methyltransferase [bacterium]
MKPIHTSRFAAYGKYTKREKMVALIRNYGIRDRRILDAFLTVPRHCFVPEADQEKAYRDQALPIGRGQTISQPYVIALMLEHLQLKPNAAVLEIGSGSGYVLALLSLLSKRVYGIELEKELVLRSRTILKELQITNATVVCGNGYHGHPPAAPYDAILLSAAPQALPEELLLQLKPSGKLILPVGKFDQLLVLYEQIKGEWKGKVITDVRFVPLRQA